MGTVGTIISSEILEGSTITLHDINEKNLELVRQACESAINKKKSNFTLEATTNRTNAIKDANFIINSIEVAPRFDLLDQDYKIPLNQGCMQLSGENGGPGALFHSLRVIPPILDICEDIMKICPNALFINYSNPMTRVCSAINRKFPSLKFVGLCHEFYHFLPSLSRILDIPINQLDVEGYGLNHFGVITKCRDKTNNEDLYPIIREKGPEFFYNVNLYDGFKFIGFFLEKYGYLPYTTDSHYGEYIPWAWDKADVPAIRQFWKGYEGMMGQQYLKLKKLIQKGKGARLVKPENEPAIPIIEGILTDSNYVEPSVNIPNDNIITNIPENIVVECPALINREGLNGIPFGDYPLELIGYIRAQVSVIDLVLESIFQESKDLALKAILIDPLVSSYNQAERILNQLLRLQEKYIQIKLE
ncbi:MAG: alpha-glucosidase [Candidatus Lokiarchaeota archaeon]|nr:alpha-glucosidase [Candidatus Lokiarchaeota archaeon]MBD3200790.1 alpha-glucosidase [Candidatus Lokiarchaeota archaeon]